LAHVRPSFGTYGRYEFDKLPSLPIELRGDFVPRFKARLPSGSPADRIRSRIVCRDRRAVPVSVARTASSSKPIEPPPPCPPDPPLSLPLLLLLLIGADTETVASCITCSPSAPHVSVYVNVPAVVAVCVRVPEVATAPDQLVPLAPPPLAVQLVAAVEDHVSVKELPAVTAVFAGDRFSESAWMLNAAWAVAGDCDASMLGQLRPNVKLPACAITFTDPTVGWG
jgi:hypothetical protein